MNSKRINYIKNYGAKATIVSELFKENELRGKQISETQAELLQNDIVRSRMLSEYTRTYQKNKDSIDWVNNVG